MCLILGEDSCEVRIVRGQPRLHSAIGRAGEYYRPLVDVKDIGRKTWHKDIVRLLKDRRPFWWVFRVGLRETGCPGLYWVLIAV
jgi:hypothetical protein